MRRSRGPSCWPSALQESLLTTLVTPDAEQARAAWRRWRREADFDALDRGSFRLLPRLYRRLCELGLDDPMLGRLKGIWRRTWYENQKRADGLADVVAQLTTLGIDTMVLKGMALSLTGYADLGQRPMFDVDVLVPRREASRALNHLRSLGLVPREARPEALFDVLHGVALRAPDRLEIDLHWHLLKEACDDASDAVVWSRAQPVSLRGVPTRVPAPTDQLFHAVVHGLHWNLEPPLRWVVDGAALLATHTLDWTALCELAEATQLTLVVGVGLDYLRTRFALPVPASVTTRLLGRRHSLFERIEYRHRLIAGDTGLLGNLPQTLLHYRRLSAARAPLMRVTGLPRFLKDWWQLDGFGALPGIVGRKVLVRLLKTAVRGV